MQRVDSNLRVYRSAPTPLLLRRKVSKERRRQPFKLTTDSRQRVDLSMKPGSVSETVTVSSAPTVLETETSSRGQVIGTQQIENLPLNGRSYADLALLAPGVRKSFLENQSTTSREASFNVNGQRSAFNNFLLEWSGQQLVRHVEPGICERKYSSVARCGIGVPFGDRQLQCGVWQSIGRCDQREYPSRDEPVPWSGLGLYPQHGPERDWTLRPGRRDKTHVHPQPVWRDLRRPDLEGPHLLLHGL